MLVLFVNESVCLSPVNLVVREILLSMHDLKVEMTRVKLLRARPNYSYHIGNILV